MGYSKDRQSWSIIALVTVAKASVQYESNLQSCHITAVHFEPHSSLLLFTSKESTSLEPHGALGSQDIFWYMSVVLISLFSCVLEDLNVVPSTSDSEWVPLTKVKVRSWVFEGHKDISKLPYSRTNPFCLSPYPRITGIEILSSFNNFKNEETKAWKSDAIFLRWNN